MSPFDFKLAFQNVDIIWVWLLKQSCRTFILEQLLVLEIFELPYKLESNLKNGSSGNSVNKVNSASGRHLTVGELPTSSRCTRGHLWLRAGMGRLLRGFSMLLGRAIKPTSSPFFSISSPLFFRRHRLAPTSSRRRYRPLPVSAKHVTAPPTPCEPSRPDLGARFRRDTLRIAFHLRGRPQRRRARLIVASKLW